MLIDVLTFIDDFKHSPNILIPLTSSLLSCISLLPSTTYTNAALTIVLCTPTRCFTGIFLSHKLHCTFSYFPTLFSTRIQHNMSYPHVHHDTSILFLNDPMLLTLITFFKYFLYNYYVHCLSIYIFRFSNIHYIHCAFSISTLIILSFSASLHDSRYYTMTFPSN